MKTLGTTAACLALTFWSFAAPGWSLDSDAPTLDDYRTAAGEAFAEVTPYFSENPPSGKYNYWQLGCTFDTVLDYLRFLDPSERGTVAAAYGVYTKIEKAGCWYDDYGWWGIASSKAYDDNYTEIFGTFQENFQSASDFTWDVMHKGKSWTKDKHLGAPNVWKNRDNGEHTGHFTKGPTWAVPRVPNGVWQGDMWSNKRPLSDLCWNNEPNPSDPIHTTLGPFQDTVVNGLYFELALRRQQAGLVDASVATNQYGFFHKWFSFKDPVPPSQLLTHSLLKPLPANAHLVRERVSTYAKCTETGCKPGDPEIYGHYPKVQGFHKDQAWAGDQGLLLGGLVDYAATLEGSEQNKVLDVAKGIIHGVATPVDSGGLSQDGVVQPTVAWQLGDPGDYLSGAGIFWRYLLYAYDKNETIKQLIGSDSTLKNMILSSAADAYAKVGTAVPGSDNPIFYRFNHLATLTTAIHIMQDQGWTPNP